LEKLARPPPSDFANMAMKIMSPKLTDEPKMRLSLRFFLVRAMLLSLCYVSFKVIVVGSRIMNMAIRSRAM
jgi:hypothetical protein